MIDELQRQFDDWAMRYDADVRHAEWGFENYCDGLEWVLCRAFECGRPVCIVDLGCGTAQLAELLREQGRSCKYVGVDLSPAMLAIARTRSAVSCCLQCDMRDVEHWIGRIDPDLRTVIVSTYALHHFPDDDKIELVQDIFRRAPQPDLEVLAVDYAFLDQNERAGVFNDLKRRGRLHVVAEIESEYYADLGGLSAGLMASGLRLRYERNGIWDWRYRMSRMPAAAG